MAERSWLLNDSAPVTLAQEFEAAAAELAWGFHDVAPVTLSMQFAAAAAPWTATYWTPAELAFNGAEAGAAFQPAWLGATHVTGVLGA